MKLWNRKKTPATNTNDDSVSGGGVSRDNIGSSSYSATGGSKSNGNGKKKNGVSSTKKKSGTGSAGAAVAPGASSSSSAAASSSTKNNKNKNKNGNNPNNNNANNNNTNSNNTNMTVFRVTVPENINPGEEFQVYAGSRIVRVRCPLDSRPGQSLQITVPADNTNNTNGSNGSGNNNNGNKGMNGSGNSNNNNSDNTTTGRNNNNNNNTGGGPRRINSNVSSNNTNGTNNSTSEQQQRSPAGSAGPRSFPDHVDNSIQNTQPPPSLNYQQSTGSTGSTSSSALSADVRRIADSNPPAYMVSVPDGVDMGTQFPVTIRGQQLMVTCPPNARPGMSVRIVPPPPPPQSPLQSQSQQPSIDNNIINNSNDGNGEQQQQKQQSPPTTDLRQNVSNFGGTSSEFASQQQQQQQQQQNKQQRLQPQPPKQEKEKTQLFEVEVPRGVQPGAPFALLAGGVRVLVTCPANAGPGQRIRFKLPLALTQATQQHQQEQLLQNPDGSIRYDQQQHMEMQQIKLKYDKDGWTRTVRATDLKFQWIRMDNKGGIDLLAGGRFHMDKSAYVRRLEFRQSDDPRVRTGILSLVPATESVVDSKIKSADGRDLVTYSDLARAQMKIFDDKTEWFQDTCAQLCVEWNEGHMRMNIRRSHMLGDSVDAVMSLSRKDLRKLWRFEFIGEMGIDAGGLAREWFELVCQEIFDPDMGLWMSSVTNQMSMTINPASEYCCDDHLVYYRFLGRVMGKAMFDRQLVKGHMVKHLYKHILGWPIYFKDLESVDEEYYNNLKQLRTMHENGDDISMLCLDFTMTSEIMGIKKEIELVKGGADIEVTNDNFPEYVEACLKYKLMGSVQPQLNELLLGFFDVIPEPLLTIFDYQELELIMCGLPHIDIEDWKAHTEYSGDYEEFGMHHPKVEWFWETLEEFNDEMRARLLLFVTGTSGVPSRGFGVLQSNDGNIRNFTIHGISAEICYYPRAHTCFNRIDLPLYESKEQLKERLKLAVTMSATGFDIE